MTEFLDKVVVIGDAGVGKTSLISRYVHNIFRSDYKTTIGVDFSLKVFNRHETQVKLQLWDIAGQERFTSVTRIYYRDTLGVVVVFDTARFGTLQSVQEWKKSVDDNVNRYYDTDEPLPAILIANKIDIAPKDWKKTRKEAMKLCKKLNFLEVFETSAKDSSGIDEAFNTLVDEMILKRPKIFKEAETSQSVNLKKKEDALVDECAC